MMHKTNNLYTTFAAPIRFFLLVDVIGIFILIYLFFNSLLIIFGEDAI